MYNSTEKTELFQVGQSQKLRAIDNNFAEAIMMLTMYNYGAFFSLSCASRGSLRYFLRGCIYILVTFSQALM